MQSRVSLRAAARVVSLVRDFFGCDLPQVSWTTARRWLLRIGLAELRQPKPWADDWIWFVDFSVQIGRAKCLVILAIRRCQLPPPGQCLRHEHLRLIHLALLAEANQHTVLPQFNLAVEKTGTPRAFVSDHGAELLAAIRSFIKLNPQTSEIYDITHKAACLLKNRLEKDLRWGQFGTKVGSAKQAIQQTELAALTPPGQRSKSRYMNLKTLLGWANKILILLSQPEKAQQAGFRVARVQEKLGWVNDYAEAVKEWSEWHALVLAAEGVLRKEGLTAGVQLQVGREMASLLRHDSGVEVAKELLSFVAEQVSKVGAGERLPATTEVLESCFGKLKAVEGDQAKNGFTGLVLALGAMVGKRTEEDVQRALQKYAEKAVKRWCEKNLPRTVQSEKRQVYRICSASKSDTSKEQNTPGK